MTFRILFYALVTFLAIAIRLTSGYPDGAPDSTCDSMMPSHDNAESQTSNSPYTISLSSTTVQAGETIEVTLTSDSKTIYKGLLLKAISVNEDTGAAGSFIIHDNDNTLYYTLNCSGSYQNAITHCDNSYKKNLTATWIAPANNGKYIFAATVVREYSTFWAKFFSDDSVEVVGGSSTPIPSTTSAAAGFSYDYNQCGLSSSCMGYPSDCISNEDCSVLLTFRPTPGEDNFISFVLISDSEGYVAMGLSEDQNMGDDSVLECMSTSPNVQMYASVNNDEDNVMEGNNNEFFTFISGSLTDGVLKCEFKRNLTTTVGGITTDLENAYFILLALGPLTSDGTDIDYHDSRLSSSIAINLASDQFIIVDSGNPPLPIEIIMHGSLMVIAWVLMASIAVFLARFYKDMWPKKMHCGVRIWFAWHRGLNVVNVIITIAALILIFIYTGTDTAFAKNAHPSMGIVTIILMLMQPIGAVFRPMPGTPNRNIFNWIHFTGGMLACACGVITINLAVTLKSSHLKTYFYYIINGFVLFYMLMFGCMEYLIHKNLPKEKAEVEVKMATIAHNGPSSDVAVVKTQKKIHYKEVLLGIFCCGAICFAAALIAVIAIS